MQQTGDDSVSPRERRNAMVRIFGGTALAFVILFAIALLVKPDLMQAMTGLMMSMMR